MCRLIWHAILMLCIFFGSNSLRSIFNRGELEAKEDERTQQTCEKQGRLRPDIDVASPIA